MAAKIFDFIEIKYTELNNQILTYLQSVYSKSGLNYGPASPYGQMLEIQTELFQHNIVYLKNAVNQINIEESTNDKVIKNIARIAGLDVVRPISATGTLKFKLKAGIKIDEEIKGSSIVIQDDSILKNKTNDLNYTIKLGTNTQRYTITPGFQFFTSIVQGKYDTQRFTGQNILNQSVRVNVPSSASIENFRYVIRYNGTVLNIKKHLYDMLPGELSCYTRTGFNGGLDIFFGNGNFGFIPSEGTIIEVTYLLSNGSEGDILNPVINDWRSITDFKDGQGNTIKIEDLFDISVETPINFSADSESSTSIKATIPFVSKNFVLATPDQFIFHLRRLNMFSKVNAFNTLEDNNFSMSEQSVEDSLKRIKSSINKNESRDKVNVQLDRFLDTYSKYKTNLNDNEIYLYLIPSIEKYFNDNVNYFNVPFDVFYLDDDEQSKVVNYLRQVGTLALTTNIKIVQPNINRYVLHIYIRRFDDVLEDTIKDTIISNVSDYLLQNNRYDRIPKSELVKIIKSINGVDSASVNFVSKKNEDYHKTASEQNINSEYNKNVVLGLDPVYGDIVVEKDEYAIIRGGWRDRNGIWYNENPNQPGLTSINVTFEGVTKT